MHVDEPLYDVTVQLTGRDGNAGSIMSSVSKALRRAGVPAENVAKFREEAMSGDYNNLLRTAMRWVHVE